MWVKLISFLSMKTIGFSVNSITDGCGSERPTPDIRFLLQDCVLSFILNNSVNSLSNLQIRDSFEILMTSRFQNCPWFSKLIKNWLSYLRSKVWVSETHTLQFLTILTPISNRVKSCSAWICKLLRFINQMSALCHWQVQTWSFHISFYYKENQKFTT